MAWENSLTTETGEKPTSSLPSSNSATCSSTSTSLRICRAAPGRCTFTTTRSPPGRTAPCTCPIDAEAKGCSSKLSKACSKVNPSSCRITSPATATSSGEAWSWSFTSSRTMSSGRMSGRVLRSCPNLTKVGPSSSNISRMCRPRCAGGGGFGRRQCLKPGGMRCRSKKYPNPWRKATSDTSRIRSRLRMRVSRPGCLAGAEGTMRLC